MADKVRFIPDCVMYCEYCGGMMIEASIGSTNLACIQCGRVKYGN